MTFATICHHKLFESSTPSFILILYKIIQNINPRQSIFMPKNTKSRTLKIVWKIEKLDLGVKIFQSKNVLWLHPRVRHGDNPSENKRFAHSIIRYSLWLFTNITQNLWENYWRRLISTSFTFAQFLLDLNIFVLEQTMRKTTFRVAQLKKLMHSRSCQKLNTPKLPHWLLDCIQTLLVKVVYYF